MLRVRRKLRSILYPFLRVEVVCYATFAVRFYYLALLRRKVRSHADAAGVIAPDYSKRMLLRGKTSDRPLRLIRPLSVIDALAKDASVLSVGCRFETELLYLRAYGFNPEKMRGLDMITYSPWVDLGNMHQMPYPDSSWEAIILGWVISYSETPERAAEEVVRVARDGALIAIGVSYYPMEMIREAQRSGATVIGDPKTRRQTVASLLELFDGHVDKIYFSHDAPDAASEGVCTVIFSIKK